MSNQVKKRRFGRTGLEVPEVTYGGGWVGGLLIRADQATAHAMLDRAMTVGVDWVDTAAAYGNGVSEQVIGAWLKTRGVDARPRLSTKFAVDAAAGDFKGQIRRSLEASLERLGESRVEVLILHNSIAADGASDRVPRDVSVSEVLGPGGIADALDQLKGEGLFDHLGLTGLGTPVALADVVDSGRFDIAQIYANLLNPSAVRAVAAGWNSTDFARLADRCRSQDMGVMGIRIFAAGHLATDVRHGREIPITANAEGAAEELRARAVRAALGDSHGTRAQTALRYGLGLEQLSTIVVGIGETSHFDEVLGAVEKGPLPADALKAVEALWDSDPAFTG